MSDVQLACLGILTDQVVYLVRRACNLLTI